MRLAVRRISKSSKWLALFGSTALALGLAGAAAGQDAAVGSDLARGFRDPPASARPRVWWHWMNGNITKDGIREDIEWMSRVGIGGLQNFDAALQTPQIVDHRLVYMTPEWKDAFRYAADLAQQKGLELTVASSPGWSETGGPWVPPKDGMKKLVWSEAVVEGGRSAALRLPAPPQVTGPFQDMPRNANLAAADTGKPDPTYFADVAVLAFPLPAGADTKLAPHITTSDGAPVAGDLLSDGRFREAVAVPRGSMEAPGFLLADFGRPQRVRSVSLAVTGAAAMFRAAGIAPRLEVEDGPAWRKIADLPLDGGVQTTVSFAPVTAQRFRVVLAPLPPQSPDFLGSVPGAVVMPLFQADARPTIPVSELRFSDEERVDRFEAKAGFAVLRDYFDLKTDAAPSAPGVDPGRVIDLTAKMKPDGTLDWTPPAGRWKVLRFGYSLVGTTNHPAPVEATGLEVDKYDGAAVRRYMETYIGNLRQATGPDLIGPKGLRALLTDSIEVGASNWTPGLVEAFQRLRGYDPRPWLPTLTGVVVGNRTDSDRFLFDFRTTLADLIASEHYGSVAQAAHANDLKLYGEALESGRPSLGDDLTMRSHTDVPMAALWTYNRQKGPRVDLLGDMKGAASVAHIYGQNVVAAESLTAAFSPWAFAPADLKPVIDLEFAHGVNRPVIHTSVHQPVDDKLPGLSLGPFGQYFNRHETWAEMARPWVDYLARTAFMLQQGRDVADVAYFYGEDAPITVLYERRASAALPQRYAFDFVNRDILEHELSVSDGELVARGGARYRVLFLGPGSAHMTLPVLRRIAALAEAGATVVGRPPADSPGLPDAPEDFAATVKRLWSGSPVTKVGKGLVIDAASVDEALAAQGVPADFHAAGAADGDVLFVHRRLSDGHAYFLTNRRAAPLKTEARFRVNGYAPEIWRADTGSSEPVSYRIEGPETVIPLDMAADDAFFVVFRKPAAQPAFQAPEVKWRARSTLDGGWDVAFQPGRGAPPTTRLPALASLAGNADPAIRYFSGISTYTKSFQAPRRSGPLMLDLGQVGDVAQVWVNGQEAGTAWKRPYRVDIGRLVHPGANKLEVRVANLWVNRLIGDAQPGAKPTTFTTMPTYHADAPLRPSGLIGPVTLMEPDPH